VLAVPDEDEDERVKPPWYAGREIGVYLFRINRRPRAQGNLFSQGVSDPPFIDHLTEVLLMGTPVVTGRRHQREWLLGNREIDSLQRYLSGWVGYDTTGPGRRDRYDDATKSWVTEEVEEERTAKAPFAIAVETRLLGVARHPTFRPGPLAVVFESVLNQGESTRQGPTTDWGVEPLLDEPDFERWLAGTTVLDRVTFSVKLPNPDADESFRQISEHLRNMDSDLTHTLRPRDKDRGLSKDFQEDPISQGLLEMAKRSFAQVTAKGKSAIGRLREYSQTDRVRQGHVTLPQESLQAQQSLGDYTVQQDAPGSADGS